MELLFKNFYSLHPQDSAPCLWRNGELPDAWRDVRQYSIGSVRTPGSEYRIYTFVTNFPNIARCPVGRQLFVFRLYFCRFFGVA